MHLGVEDREALPVRGEDVGVGVLDLDDEALELEPAKVVAAAALGVGGGVGSEQPGDEWPQGLVGKTYCLFFGWSYRSMTHLSPFSRH